MRGTTVLYNHGLAFHDTRFQRAPLGQGLPDPTAAWGADAGTTFAEAQSRRKLFPLLIALAVTSDFGLENWTFAAGVFGPNGVGRLDFPDYGAQSFMLTDLDVIVERALVRAGLWDEVKDRLGESGTALSGGQQQRLCIARAIAVDPEVILMDEPCSALDPIATAKIEELIHELRGKYAIVIVTHNMQQAARVSQRTAFFHLGTLVEYGKTTDIFTNPKQERTKDYITGRYG